MSGEIAYKLTADEAQALQAVARLSREFGLNETAIKKAATAAQELDRTQQQMSREGQRIFQETRTEAERYEQQLDRLGKLHQANAIDAETYGRAVKQVQQQHQSAFGQQALSQLEAFADGFNPAIKAAEMLKQVLADVAEMKEKATHRDMAAEFDEGSLAELTKGDPEKGKRLMEISRGIAKKAGMDRQQAGKLTFALGSAEMLDSADEFADAYGQSVVRDPENLLRSSAAFRNAFGKRTGTEQILNLAMGAAEASPSKANELLAASAKAAAYAPAAGISEQELLGGTAINAGILDPEGGASQGGTAMRALAKALARLRSGKDENGKELATDEEGHLLDDSAKAVRKAIRHKLAGSHGLMEELHGIESLHLDSAQLQKAFGRQEGYTAYSNILNNEGGFSKSMQDQADAQKSGLFKKILHVMDNDPQLKSARELRLQTANEEEAAQQYSPEHASYLALRAHERAVDLREGHPYLASARSAAHNVADVLPGAEKRTLVNAVESGELFKDAEGFRLSKQIIDQQGGQEAFAKGLEKWGTRGQFEEKFARAIEKFERASDKISPPQRPTLAPPNSKN